MCEPLTTWGKIKEFFNSLYSYKCIRYLNDNILSLERKLTIVRKSADLDKTDLNHTISKQASEIRDLTVKNIGCEKIRKELKLAITKYMTDINSLKNQLTILRKELKKAQSKAVVTETIVKIKNKLTCDDIRLAKKAHANGESLSNIASTLGVSPSTISRAIKCKTYKECCEK